MIPDGQLFWRSIDDPPARTGYYLVVRRGEEVGFEWWNEEVGTDALDWRDVTHWMPPPARPGAGG